MKFHIPNINIKKRIIINTCDIDIPLHQITVINGKNGTGKTLLLNHLFSYCEENGFSVCMMDQSNDMLLNRYNILENIAISDNPQKCEEALELLKKYDLENLHTHKANELSGGEKRIICLLRCMLRKPQFLFLDEPTNDLDYIMVNKMLNILQDLSKSCTIIIVSHDDRVSSIASMDYTIENKNIVLKNALLEKDIQEKSEVINEMSYTIPSTIIKKGLTPIYIKRIILIVFSACMIFFTATNQYDSQNQIDYDIKANEVNIFIPLSDYSLTALNEAVPISALACFNDELSFTEKMEIYQENLSKQSYLSINFGLEISDNDQWQVFENEFFNVKDQECIYPLKLYEENYLDGQQVDTSEYFTFCTDLFSDTESENTISLNIKQYNSMMEGLKEELENEEAQCTWITIVLNDMDFFDFINSDDIAKLMNGNFYVLSQETIEFMKQANTFMEIKSKLEIFGITAIIYMILILCISVLIGMVNKKPLKIYRNQGIAKKELKKITKSYMRDRKFSLLCMIITILIMMLIVFLNGNAGLAISYIGIVIYIFVVVICTHIQSFLGRITVNQVYNWRKRR